VGGAYSKETPFTFSPVRNSDNAQRVLGRRATNVGPPLSIVNEGYQPDDEHPKPYQGQGSHQQTLAGQGLISNINMPRQSQVDVSVVGLNDSRSGPYMSGSVGSVTGSRWSVDPSSPTSRPIASDFRDSSI